MRLLQRVDDGIWGCVWAFATVLLTLLVVKWLVLLFA